MTTTESNKLIAEFMGLPVIPETDIYEYLDLISGETLLIHPNQMKFDTSWDWLMPVVEKIELLDSPKKYLICDLDIVYCGIDRELGHNYYSVEILPSHTDTFKRIATQATTKIEATYKAVVEFIKWYNENK